MNSFSDRLRAAIRAARLSNQAFADRVGMSRQNVSSYTQGRVEPRPARVQAFADALGVDARWLGDGDPAREAALVRQRDRLQARLTRALGLLDSDAGAARLRGLLSELEPQIAALDAQVAQAQAERLASERAAQAPAALADELGRLRLVWPRLPVEAQAKALRGLAAAVLLRRDDEGAIRAEILWRPRDHLGGPERGGSARAAVWTSRILAAAAAGGRVRGRRHPRDPGA